ncbi:MAG: C40 family peptidase [Bacteroidales bacterium]
MRHLFIWILLFLMLFGSGCNLFRQQPERPKSKTDRSGAKYEAYSNAFGYTLNGDEDLLLLETINAWLGTPYKYGGCTKEGTDCSCLITNVFKTVYQLDLPRKAQDMSAKAKKIKAKHIQEGDLLFFKIKGNHISHVGLHISKGYFVHASTSQGVVINHLSNRYYATHFAYAGRIREKSGKH